MLILMILLKLLFKTPAAVKLPVNAAPKAVRKNLLGEGRCEALLHKPAERPWVDLRSPAVEDVEVGKCFGGCACLAERLVEQQQGAGATGIAA